MQILISGHSSGIGKSIAELASERGHIIYGISRRKLNLLNDDNQLSADLSKLDEIERSVNWLKNKKINMFIHSAGANDIVCLEEATAENYTTAFNLHVLSASQIVKPILKHMKSNSGGKVILISSIWSKISCHSRGPYSIAKSGLNALARQIAVEFGDQNITAQSLILGFVNSPLSSKTANDELLSTARNRILTKNKKLSECKNIAESILDIASINNCYMNGSNIYMDAGILCR
tara:strand:- start:129 stop:830 length:702 start_codon:yes stop_codon:yes gene_type:complete